MLKNKKLTFILGSSRSGSSLFENFLSKWTGQSALGELRWFYERGVINNEKCTCGKWFLDCEYWSEIYNDISLQEFRDINKLRQYFDNPINIIPFYFGLLKSKKWKLNWNIYSSFLKILYSKILKRSEYGIIDNSKSPFYLIILKNSLKVDIEVVYFTRSVFGVVHSYSKFKKRTESRNPNEFMRRKNFFHAAIYWLLIDWVCFFLILKNQNIKSHIITYEKFCLKPEIILSKFKYRNSVKKSHSISGNPNRILGLVDKIIINDKKIFFPKFRYYILKLISNLSLARK